MAERFLRERFGAEVMRPPHLRHLLRRRPDGGRHLRGRVARRPPRARPARLPLRRQPDHDRRRHRARVRTEDVEQRFDAYGWHDQHGRRRQRPRRDAHAIAARRIAEEARPTLIRVRSTIASARRTRPARGARTARRSARTRCARRRRRSAGTRTRSSSCRTASYEHFERGRARRRRAGRVGAALRRLGGRRPERAAEWDDAWAGQADAGPRRGAPALRGRARQIATRAASGEVMQAFAPFLPTMVGGAADLNETSRPASRAKAPTAASTARATSFWGVREHAMGAAVNGLALHGGIVKPYGVDVLRLRRLHAPGDPALRADAASTVRLGLHPRLGRGRRGRPDAPAGRAPRRAARDPGPDGDPPDRRERDGRARGA